MCTVRPPAHDRFAQDGHQGAGDPDCNRGRPSADSRRPEARRVRVSVQPHEQRAKVHVQPHRRGAPHAHVGADPRRARGNLPGAQRLGDDRLARTPNCFSSHTKVKQLLR